VKKNIKSLNALISKLFRIFLCGLFFLFTTGLFAEVSYSQKDHAQEEPSRAMWVWDAKVIEDKEATEGLLDFCQKKNIDLLFYSAYNVRGKMTPICRKFNSRAHRRNISVHALAGDPRWAFERFHKRALDWAEGVLMFNFESQPHERFDGLHSDVEPYLFKKAWEENKAQILREYLDMNEKIMQLIKERGIKLKFFADIPFWYDDDPNMSVEWKGKYAPACFHMLDVIDAIVVMDYRNFAEGENGSIKLIKGEMDYASKKGKKVYIGQETKANLYHEHVTFGGKSIAHMETELKKLVDTYINHPSFAGVAIHHYLSYKRLIRKSK